ncbi:hypothetical protein FA95DRAFT_1573582 [Auriscalpium vulgare]|uniref:Uncharacterized protein n=1 Tax=Auriscalpium vulgare TaxID=40419 RepID=A0ACB8RNE8_9AGAM|nr:hypothetical protein FA95DRAFT_1573582 [Auriscalpium vulgare]
MSESASEGEDHEHDLHSQVSEEASEAAPDLFTLSSGASAAFHLRRMTDEDAETLAQKILEHGGEVVDVEQDADVVLTTDRADHLRLVDKYASSQKTYVRMSGFVDICLVKNSFSLEVPQPKRNPRGRRVGARVFGNKAFLRRNPFTEQDDQNLVEYLAQTIPIKEEGSRTGHVIYQELIHYAAEHNEKPWALEHTADSWRERYRKHQEEFDLMIDAYVEGHSLTKKGQYLEIRNNRDNRLSGKGAGGDNREEDRADEEQHEAETELRREEEEEEEEEEVPPADPPQHESPARSQARAGGSQKRARVEDPVDAQRPLRSGPPARKKRREAPQIPQPQQVDSVPDVEAGLEAREVQAGPSRIRRSPAPSPSQPAEEQETAMPMTPPTTQLWSRPHRQVEVVVPARPKPPSAKNQATRPPPPVPDSPATRTRVRSTSVEPRAQSALRSRQQKVPFKAARRRPAVDLIVEETPQPEVPDEDGDGESMEVEAYLGLANGDDGLFDEGVQDSIVRLSSDDLQTAQRLFAQVQPKSPSIPPFDNEGDNSGMLAKLKQTQQRAPTSRVVRLPAKSLPTAPRRPVVRRRYTGESEEEFPSPHTRARDEKDRRVRQAKDKEFQPQPGTRAAELRAAITARNQR